MNTHLKHFFKNLHRIYMKQTLPVHRSKIYLPLKEYGIVHTSVGLKANYKQMTSAFVFLLFDWLPNKRLKSPFGAIFYPFMKGEEFKP